ncbi:hypothetical protein [Demequina activiva]|uniref:Uncharacterized protein n=1 Tax=Demequina activiva TaxID=1582364 RepID=A0A919Q0L8_9MICO|nr:hypothetical protein [Demequina activiva]GIG53932.1 hypothetical protein Dac01nite_06840 [Demequina activiva]
MEPFSMTLGTQVKAFHLEDNDATVVITTTDTAHPERPAHVGYESCENESESQAVVQKFVFDLQRQGWEMSE